MDYSTTEVFQKVVSDEVEKFWTRALVKLEKEKSLVSKPSDKGGTLVLMDQIVYKKMSEGSSRLLPWPYCATWDYLNQALDDKIISKKGCNSMLPKHPQMVTFYTTRSPLWGRLSLGVDSVTQNIWIYLDRALRQFCLSRCIYEIVVTYWTNWKTLYWKLRLYLPP